MSKSRVNNSIRNIVINVSTQVLNYVLRFLTRTIFIHELGKEVLGLNGLFMSILYFLSFSELGISTVIGYLLYKPLATNDQKKISVLMRVLRNSYWAIGFIITVLGFACIPFFKYIILDYDMNPYSTACFIVFILTSSLSYIFSYKSTLLIIDQKEYIFSLFNSVFLIMQNIIQIILLIFFHSYLYYLIAALGCVLLLNYCISKYVDTKYNYIKVYSQQNIDKDTKQNIFKLIKASLFNNIGSSILSSSDNVIYSSLFGLGVVGEISNYTLICTSAFLINARILNAITPSIGNYCALENKDKQYTIFRCTMLLVFYICSLISISLLISIQDIIILWIGKEYLIDYSIVFFIILNSFCIYLAGPVYTFQVTCGYADRLVYKRVFQVIINIVLSIVLGLTIGVKGVILATIFSFVLTIFWMEPNLVFREGFGISPKKYYIQYIYYLLIFVFEYAFMLFISTMFDNIISLGILKVIIKIVVSCLMCTLFCIVTTFRHKENEILRTILISKINTIIK